MAADRDFDVPREPAVFFALDAETSFDAAFGLDLATDVFFFASEALAFVVAVFFIAISILPKLFGFNGVLLSQPVSDLITDIIAIALLFTMWYSISDTV